MKKDKQHPAFPTEAIFPGIHGIRPDIAAQEAEAFLAGNHEPDGFDLSDPATRARMLDVPATGFIDFQVNPVPVELREPLAQLDSSPDYGAAHEAICQAADALLQLPPHLYATVNENGALWICLKPKA